MNLKKVAFTQADYISHVSAEEDDGDVAFDNGGTVTPVDDDLFTDGPFEEDEQVLI